VDCRLEQNLFRGELTYFYCTGNAVDAARDRRRSWQNFAPDGFQLLPLPGLHGACNLDPQYTALTDLLRACLNGEPLTASDPATVFERSYRIERRGQRESIVSSTGEVYGIDEDVVAGYLETFKTEALVTRFGGWAVEACQRRPARTIAVFLGDQFLGYGASGTSPPGGAGQPGAGTASYAGFLFNFRRVVSSNELARPRLFVLSSNGRAAELRISTEEELMALRARLADYERLADVQGNKIAEYERLTALQGTKLAEHALLTDRQGARLAEYERLTDGQGARLAEYERLTDGQGARLAEYERLTDGQGAKLAEYERLTDHQGARLAEAEKMLAGLQAECSERVLQLDAIKNSTCWRITWPLRRIRHIAARFWRL
jgi:hypothetical protein